MQENHKRFSHRYFETLNAKESAIYAGFSEDTAKQQGWQLLQREDVQECLSKLRDNELKKGLVTRERLIEEYSKIAFSDVRDLLTLDGGLKDISQIEDNTAGAIASIESYEDFNRDGEKVGTNRKIKMYDKLRALDSLGKHLGIFEKDNDQKTKAAQVTIFQLPDNGRDGNKNS